MRLNIRGQLIGKRKQQRRQMSSPNGYRQRRSLAILFLLLLLWSICLGWGLSIAVSATTKTSVIAQATSTESGTVDTVPAKYQLGKEFYVENCGSCHLALPPEIMPTETWRRLLLEPDQHYGTQIQPTTGPSLLVMWQYLQTFSRPEVPNKQLPYRVSESRFFKALHPRVKLPQVIKITSCVSCHPRAAQYNYRSLTPEWTNSP